ncbi:MAG: hypothetical protein E4G98_04565 [Promethearchaeota archaeon]|nr:MAG: hypothetical protein E4G98_04565 [Candidatus Lokiarchaeota archaeon]
MGRISKNEVHHDPISDAILSYLKEIEDSNNVISDLKIQLDDVQIHFSKFHCQIGTKSFPLYLVWRNSKDNSLALTREMEKMKEKMNALLVSDGGVPAMVG